MKKIVNIFFPYTLFSLLMSCEYVVKDNSSPLTGTVQSPYYVQVYIIPDNFDLKESRVDDSNYTLRITFTGEELREASDLTSDKFYEVANNFGDGSYTGYVLPWENQAVTEAIASIDVVCDKDFNEQHPAGSSLGNIMMLGASSPYEFIRAGYQKVTIEDSDYPKYWEQMALNDGVGYKPVKLLVSSVNEENSQMLYPYCYLYFEEEPAQSGEYVFTVTIRTSEGKEFTQTISYTYTGAESTQ